MAIDPDEELLQEAKQLMLEGLSNLELGEPYSRYDVAYWVTGIRPRTEAELGTLCLRDRKLALLLEYLERTEMRRVKVTLH